MTPHGAIPGDPLPPRDASPCPLGGDCGPIVVDPTTTSTSSASLPSATTCTHHRGPVPIGTECFESGPHAGQCISFECLEFPNTCGCPGAPPEPAQLKRSAASSDCGLDEGCGPTTGDPVISTPTSASSASLPSATTCVVRDAGPIGFECFTSGPHEGQCITILCLEHPDTCGCPGIDVGKRSEVNGHNALLRRYLLRFQG